MRRTIVAMRSHPLPSARRLRVLAALGVVAALAAVLLLASGCIDPFQPRVGTARAVAVTAPRPNSPQGVLQLFRWCWVNRQITEYEELFTEDFRFAFGAADSADNLPILRDDEIEIARNIFVDGSATQPRANRIDLDFNSSLLPIPDSRPGKMFPWHQEITARVVLRVETSEVIYQITGDARFFLVRGDSASIPPSLKGIVDAGPGTWYIERWEDQTGTGSSVTTGGGSVAVTTRSAQGPVATLAALVAPSATNGGGMPRAPARPEESAPFPTTTSWGQLMAIYR
jgi:hypothetical protein